MLTQLEEGDMWGSERHEKTHPLDSLIRDVLDDEVVHWPPVATSHRRLRAIAGIAAIIGALLTMAAYGVRAAYLDAHDRTPDLTAVMLIVVSAALGVAGGLLFWSLTPIRVRRRIRHVYGTLEHGAVRLLLWVLVAVELTSALFILGWYMSVGWAPNSAATFSLGLFAGGTAAAATCVIVSELPGLASVRRGAHGARTVSASRAWYATMWTIACLVLALTFQQLALTSLQSFGIVAAVTTAVVLRALQYRNALDVECRRIVEQLDILMDSALRTQRSSRGRGSANDDEVRSALQRLESELAPGIDARRFGLVVPRADIEVRALVSYLTLRLAAPTQLEGAKRYPRIEASLGYLGDSESIVLAYRLARMLRAPLLLGRMSRVQR